MKRLEAEILDISCRSTGLPGRYPCAFLTTARLYDPDTLEMIEGLGG